MWGLDRPLTYSIPEPFLQRAVVGSVVRVPLRGRRVRGWIIGLGDTETTVPDLTAIAGVSGRGPVFDEALLRMARRLARRYVQPLAYFLRLMTPPRLGRPVKAPSRPNRVQPVSQPPELNRLAPNEEAADRYCTLLDELPADGQSIIAVPEVKEGSRVLESIQKRFGDECAVIHSSVDPALRAADMWSFAEGKKRIALGGRASVFAPAFRTELVVVHSEEDDSYKERRAPYYNSRVVAEARAEETGCRVILASAVPSVESWHRTTPTQPARGIERETWPVVEVVEPERSGVPQRAIAAILQTRKSSGRSLVLLPRNRPSRAGPGPEEVVRFMRRVVPGASISRADRPGLGDRRLAPALEADVIVATEAALAEIERPPVATVIILGVDAWLNHPGYASVERGFRVLWHAAGLVVGPGRSGRLILETHESSHYAVQALVRGSYQYFASAELRERAETRFPPFVSLVRLRAAAFAEKFVSALHDLSEVEILGPAPGERGQELLIKSSRLGEILDPLRTLVAESESRISIEMDPVDI